MVNLEKARETFQEFVKTYDQNDEMIQLKIEHTYRVCEYSKQIADSIHLSKNETNLAIVIALLHDLGRFEQVKMYHSFSDFNIDHAALGIEILFQKRMIRNFLEEDQYDEIIHAAILNHNRLNVDDSLNEEQKLFSKILRDADKMDIYYVKLQYPSSITDANYQRNNEIDYISEEIITSINKQQCINRKDCNSRIDRNLICVGFVFDLNFPYSFSHIKNNHYINRIIANIDTNDQNIITQLKRIEKIIDGYIDMRIKEYE